MLSHLVYLSVRPAQSSDQEIDEILGSCQRNNGALDITGVLLYSKSHFVQYLEGENSTIFDLYTKIKEDKRHKNVVMISSSHIDEREFPSWQMGAKKMTGADVDFQTPMTDQEKDQFKMILNGEQQEGNRAISLIKKFFR